MSNTSDETEVEVVYKLNLNEPTEELLEWAKEHIREDPNTRCQLIEEFRDMIYSRGECVPHRTDDAFLLRFLRGRNFVLERAHDLIVAYYDFKDRNTEMFDNFGFDLLDRAGQDDVMAVPPYTDQLGQRMLIIRFGKWNPERLTIDEFSAAAFMVLELAILEEQAQIKGGIAIFDLAGLSMSQAWYMNPNLALRIFQMMVTSFPQKINALHVVNQPWMFDMLYNFFKPLMVDDRIQQRIFFHGDNMDSLHQHVSPKNLPDVYGGVHKNYDYKEWIKWFERNPRVIKELKSLGYKVELKEDDKSDDH